jgi:hypothetical protein
MKCKVTECNNEVVIAGPPGNRNEGLCWKHGLLLAGELAKVPPSHVLLGCGIMPICENERVMVPLNQNVRKQLGGMVLKRLEGLQCI